MSGTKKKVLVIGATGQVGKAVIPHLLGNDSIEVVAASRNLEKVSVSGVPVVYLDLDVFESIAPALTGIDRVFLMTGYTVDMLKQSKDLVDVARKAGVEQIVHLGACDDDDTHVGHYGWHQFIERYIASSGIPFYTHLRPEMFMQNVSLAQSAESLLNPMIVPASSAIQIANMLGAISIA